jgi:hypothetical protein
MEVCIASFDTDFHEGNQSYQRKQVMDKMVFS